MQDYGTVVEQVERIVYHAESGKYTQSLMEAIIYRPGPTPVLVITRKMCTPNVGNVIGSYTVISGATLGDWKKRLEESDSMLWKPLPPSGSGLDLN